MSDLPSASLAPSLPQGSAFWIEALHPLEAYGLVVGFVCLVIAAAQWLASNCTDRRALRLFALRNALAALGWIFGAPHRHSQDDLVPLVTLLVAALLLGLAV